jgi:precorrin-2/cobalt-factor-2 C20-methyltransferase
VSEARLIGVGVGPGDPELMTLKAVRILADADVVAWFAKAGHPSNALATAAGHLRAGATQLPLLYPVTTELAREDPAYVAAIEAFFDDAAEAVAMHLDQGRRVAVLSEGDPLFYGSYMHLHVRLSHRYPTEVVPGVTGLSGCWSAAGLPLAQGDDVLTVVAGTLAEGELQRHFRESNAVAVIKVGRNLTKVRRALAGANRLDGAIYVERGTMAGSLVIPLLEKADDQAPYFAVVLVPGWEARP